MTTLWYDLDEDLEDETDEDLYDKEDLERELPELDLDDMDIICPECGSVIEDGFQCQICGLMVGV